MDTDATKKTTDISCDLINNPKNKNENLNYNKKRLQEIQAASKKIQAMSKEQRNKFWTNIKSKYWADGINNTKAEQLRKNILKNMSGCDRWTMGKSVFMVHKYTNYTVGALFKGLENSELMRKYEPKVIAKYGFNAMTPYTLIQRRPDGEYEEVARREYNSTVVAKLAKRRRARTIGKEIFMTDADNTATKISHVVSNDKIPKTEKAATDPKKPEVKKIPTASAEAAPKRPKSLLQQIINSAKRTLFNMKDGMIHLLKNTKYSLKSLVNPGINEITFLPKGQNTAILLTRINSGKNRGEFIANNMNKLPRRNRYRGRVAIYAGDSIAPITEIKDKAPPKVAKPAPAPATKPALTTKLDYPIPVDSEKIQETRVFGQITENYNRLNDRSLTAIQKQYNHYNDKRVIYHKLTPLLQAQWVRQESFCRLTMYNHRDFVKQLQPKNLSDAINEIEQIKRKIESFKKRTPNGDLNKVFSNQLRFADKILKHLRELQEYHFNGFSPDRNITVQNPQKISVKIHPKYKAQFKKLQKLGGVIMKISDRGFRFKYKDENGETCQTGPEAGKGFFSKPLWHEYLGFGTTFSEILNKIIEKREIVNKIATPEQKETQLRGTDFIFDKTKPNQFMYKLKTGKLLKFLPNDSASEVAIHSFKKVNANKITVVYLMKNGKTSEESWKLR